MKNVKLTGGIYAPLLTPFHDNGSINYEELKRLTEYILKKGVHGIFISGTSGEFVNLTIKERKEVLSFLVDNIDTNILYNITAMNLKDVEDLTNHARNLGVKSVSVTTPYFHKFDMESLYKYFVTISKITEGLDLYLYNIEGLTGNPIPPELLRKVSDNTENIKGIKDSSMDFMKLLEYQAIMKDNQFLIYTGNDGQVLSGLQADGSGGVIVFASVFPELCMQIWNEFQDGNINEAKDAQNKIIELRKVCRDIMPIGSHKYLLELQGFEMGEARYPLRDLTTSEKKILEEKVKELEIIN